MVYKGIRFPSNINTPTAVSKVLNQQAGKLKASELKGISIHILKIIVVHKCVLRYTVNYMYSTHLITNVSVFV